MPNKQEILKKTSHELDVTGFLDYRNFLKQIYSELKKDLAKYSYLQMAEDLGFSRTNVIYLIISGQRPLTPKASKKIVRALSLKDRRRIYFEKLVRYQNTRDYAEREDLFEQLLQLKKQSVANLLDRSTLEFFSHWYHAVIYEMSFSPDFPETAEAIVEKLHFSLKPAEVKSSLSLLLSLGLIKMDKEKNRIIPTAKRISTPAEIESLAIVRYHQKMIELGRESITTIHESLRDVTALTMSINDEKLPVLKREIAQFREKILALSETDDSRDIVYQFNIQLFPVTKKKRDE